MKQFKIAVLALLVFVGFNKIDAQNKNNPWSINVGVNAVDITAPDPSTETFFKDWAGVDFDDNNMIPTISRLAVSRYLSNGFSLEFAASVNKIEKGYGYRGGDALTSDPYLGLDGAILYSLRNLLGKDTGWFDPYLTVGGGYSWFDWEGAGNLNGGGGVNFWFNDNIAFNLQSQYKHTFDDVDVHPYFQTSAGLKIQFGGTDTDGDGIFDDEDACPQEFGLEALQGCPDRDGDGIRDGDDRCPDVPGVAEYYGCPADKDGDGVYDKDDECPEVKGPAANNGCPWPDTDGDGVLDKDDDCPEVPGVVENNGCPRVIITEEAQAQLNEYAKSIYFDTAKSTFKPGVPEKLDMIVSIMNEYPDANFTIAGHTDSQGSETYNQGLSERRANAVMSYLIEKGISSSRLTAVGYGESYPVADNATAEGRALNRRTEINLRK